MKNALKGFGPIYVISVKSREDRRNHMKAEFLKQSVTDYQFFDAVEGATEDLSLLVDNVDAFPITKIELSCSITHLKAIQHWLQTSDSPYAIIMEDDLILDTVDDWQWNWREFLEKIETSYDMLQLAIINPGRVNTSIHYREGRDWSTGCYLIKRAWAEKLVAKHIVQDKFVFSELNRIRLVSEGVVYTGAICLSFPLFVSSLILGPNINEAGIDTMHRKSHDEVIEFWKTSPKQLKRKINK